MKWLIKGVVYYNFYKVRKRITIILSTIFISILLNWFFADIAYYLKTINYANYLLAITFTKWIINLLSVAIIVFQLIKIKNTLTKPYTKNKQTHKEPIKELLEKESLKTKSDFIIEKKLKELSC